MRELAKKIHTDSVGREESGENAAILGLDALTLFTAAAGAINPENKKLKRFASRIYDDSKKKEQHLEGLRHRLESTKSRIDSMNATELFNEFKRFMHRQSFRL